MKRAAILISALLATASLTAVAQDSDEKPDYGFDLTKVASKPKFGAYFIGSYKYNDLEGDHDGPGFNVRLLRAYVDGTIFNDFAYRVQVELNGSPHIKDFYFEWTRYKEFKVKIGQFKRAFTFENPYNPFDVGTGDYSLGVKKFSGFGDRVGEASTGGRDQGLQFQGDLFPIGNDNHRLIHYQAAVYNGNGINKADNNSRKDFIGTIQFQPIKDLYIGVFGWDGTWTSGNVTVDRKRYSFGMKYEHDNWSVRSEYIHSHGYKASSFDQTTGQKINSSDTGNADAFYATVGVPVKKWLKIYAKYDMYRDNATNDSRTAIYSFAPQIRLHKNIIFQVEYRYNTNNDNAYTAKGHDYNELWFEYYIRF